jgi:hypothetical protein
VRYQATFNSLPVGVIALSPQQDSATLTVLGPPIVTDVTPAQPQEEVVFIDENGVEHPNQTKPSGEITKGTQTLTIRGRNLLATEVTVPAEGPDEQTKAVPSVSLQDNTPTELRVAVNSSQSEVEGVYTLVIKALSGETSVDFRVVPNEITVDSYSPHRVASGNSYILVIEGRNLNLGPIQIDPAGPQHDKLTLSNLKVESQIITGLLTVSPDAVSLLQEDHLLIGNLRLSIWIMPRFINSGNGGEGDCVDGVGTDCEPLDTGEQLVIVAGVPLLFQGMKYVRPPEKLQQEATRAATQFGGTCGLRRTLLRRNYQLALGVCVTGSGTEIQFDPQTSSTCLSQAAKTGTAVEIKAIVISLFFKAELEVRWGWSGLIPCWSGRTRPWFCFRGYAGAEVVGGRGFVYAVSSCQGIGVSKWFDAAGGALQQPAITVQGINGATCFEVSPTTTMVSNPEVMQATVTANCCNNEQAWVQVSSAGRTFSDVKFNWNACPSLLQCADSFQPTLAWNFTRADATNTEAARILTARDEVGCTPPQVTIPSSFAYVPLEGDKTVEVSVSGGSVTLGLDFTKAGRAVFVVNGQEQGTPLTLTQNQQVTIRGKTTSSEVNDVKLVATAVVAGQTQELARQSFSVVAVQKVEWLDVNGNQITDPNNHPSGTVGVRIFPDATEPGGDAKNKVKVRATVTPAIANVPVFLRSIDVDDPSANDPSVTTVDDEMKTQDNLTCAVTPNCKLSDPIPINDGRFIVNGNPVGNQISAATTVANDVATATVEFQVTMQPGDNFRVVATTSTATNLTQVQAQQTDGTMARVKDATGNFISSDSTTAATVKASEVLTVWRKLHMEVDSMAAIPAGANKITGKVTGMFPGDSVKRFFLDHVSQDPDDGSAMIAEDDASSTVRSGRFENGTIKIGALSQPTQMVSLGPIQGNGKTIDGTNVIHFVQMPTTSSFAIPYAIRRGTTTVTQGTVTDFTGQDFVLSGSLSNVRAQDMLVIGGAAMTISSVSTTFRSVTVQQVNLDFELVDDDQAAMPHPSKTAFLTLFNQKYAAVYIEAVVDGGGRAGNTNDSNAVPVTLNIELENTEMRALELDLMLSDLTNGLQSDGDRGPNYWIAYVLYAYQASKVPSDANDFRADGDPNSEAHQQGVTTNPTTLGRRRGSIIFHEEAREVGLARSLPCEQRTLIHEVAHQFGLMDRTVRIGIMGDNCSLPDSDFTFIGIEIYRLRTRVESPGKKELQ